MSSIEQKTDSNDEINLFNYWRVIFKRRRLLLGVFLTISLGTFIVNLFIPKIYRGEYIIQTETIGLTLILSNVNERLKNILPKTHSSVYDIKITALPDTVASKFHILIDSKDTSDIAEIATELFAYLDNSPFYKKRIEEEKEQLQKEMDEIPGAILYMEEAIKNYTLYTKNEKPASDILNPVELYTGMINFKKRKVILEQSLKNYSDLEIVIKEVYRDPIAPKIKRNIILSALIGFLSGILLVFAAEFAEKVRTPSENKDIK